MAPKPHGPFCGPTGHRRSRGRRGLGPGGIRRGLLGRRRCRRIGGLGSRGRFRSRFCGRFRSGRRRRCRRRSGLSSRRRRRCIGSRRCRCRCVGGCGGRRSGSRRRRRRIVGGRRCRGRARFRSDGRGRRVIRWRRDGRRRIGALQRRSPGLRCRKGIRDGDRDGHAGLLDVVEHPDRRLGNAGTRQHDDGEPERDAEPHPSTERHLSSHPRRRMTAARDHGGRHGPRRPPRSRPRTGIGRPAGPRPTR